MTRKLQFSLKKVFELEAFELFIDKSTIFEQKSSDFDQKNYNFQKMIIFMTFESSIFDLKFKFWGKNNDKNEKISKDNILIEKLRFAWAISYEK